MYRQGDTILIAKTGYGKTIVLQAVSVITGQVTVQIFPLNKLGCTQVEDIKRIPGTFPILLDADTHLRVERLTAGGIIYKLILSYFRCIACGIRSKLVTSLTPYCHYGRKQRTPH